ncbi:MAG: beta-lactamase family protein [Bacteroidia bacterium]|nr:beta-lactamase family protein [Bacteroidia bacterium]NNK71786.1 beta-lactamase family protein [Flavobacteriaceae bacterium]
MQSIVHNSVRVFIGFFCMFYSMNAQQDSILVDPPKLFQLQSYIDSLAHAGMEKYHIPGAIVTIVTDSSHVFNKGYGYADYKAKIPVDKDKSIFRIASITKTFTALAVMQLVEEGKLNLQADIRNYLPDDDFDFLSESPITLHHLLTHTAGFDLTDTGDAALVPEKIIPLEEMARRHMPDRIYEPGDVHSYSNFGYTLIGYIIQEVSGIPYEEYIQTKIFKPLKMNHSGIKQPLPEPIKPNLVKSYVWEDEQVELTRDFTNTLPGGGVIASAKDMSHYMLMHLNGGSFKETELLSSEFHEMLTSQHYGSKDTRYGICYAFFENRWTGRRSIEHSGGQLGFVSLMVLIPETGTGIFIAQNNRKDAGGFRYDMTRAILDTLVGFKENNFDSIVSPKNISAIAKNYTGVYKQMNYPKNTFERISRLFGMFSTEYKIEYDGAGSLTTYGDSYVHMGDHIFRLNKPNTDYTFEFVMDESGQGERLRIGTSSYKRINWFQKKRVQQGFFIPSLFLLLIFVLSGPIGRLIRKLRKKEPGLVKEKGLRKWLYGTALILVLGALGLAVHFIIFRDQLSDYGVPLSLKFVFLLCSFGFLLALLSPYFIYKNWTSKVLGIRWKLLNSTLILFVVIVSAIYYIHNLVGFQYY